MLAFVAENPETRAMDFKSHLSQTYAKLKRGLSAKPRDYAWRVSQLKALRTMLEENDEQINQALWKDLRKSKFESVATEQGLVLAEISDALKNLQSWMRPKRTSTPLYNLPGRCEIHRDPLGLALIIGAWNYPIQLTLSPLVGAIAGGNAALIKPSELAEHTSKILCELIPRYLDQDLIAIIEADAQETSQLLDLAFDKIFFTGSTAVGKIVMSKAAQHLTPVTLELGGKSPAIVLNDANLPVAARRLVWGKFMNAGQTCVAPDYILVEPGAKSALIDELRKNIEKCYGTDPRQSPDFCRIINRRHFDRLSKLLAGEKILAGGQVDAGELYISPTLLETTVDSPIMQDEIFGPILPIVVAENLDKMILIINSRPKPLSLYVFGKSSADHERVLRDTSSGGACVNDVVMHMPVHSMPFGGVGASGMGHYHGEYSFKAFTHAKSVLRQTTWIDLPIRYAPYSPRNLRILRWLF